MNNAQFGILGSIVYGGMTLGSTVATIAFEKAKWTKYTLAITLLFNAVCLFLFTITRSFLFDVVVRFFIGFFQVF